MDPNCTSGANSARAHGNTPVPQTTADAMQRLSHDVAMDARVVPVIAASFLVCTGPNGMRTAIWGILLADIPAGENGWFGQP